MSKKLGSDFEMFNKACHVYDSFDHLKNDCNNWYNKGRFAKPVWNYNQRGNHKNFAKNTHPCSKRNIVPTVVLMKSGIKSVNAARQKNSKAAVIVNTARPVNTVHPKRTMNAAKPRPKVNTARPKAVLNVVQGNQVNAVKASACWVWRPKHKVLDHVSRNNGKSTNELIGMIDSRCSRHMTRNISYLTDYNEIDRGFLAFGGRLIVLICSELYTNDDWNEMKQLLRMELRLTLAYTYYCQLKVNAVRHKLTNIIDFLNANPIKNALTVNPTVYTSSTIRRDLKFEDEGGIDSLSNEVIFEQLTLMGVESSAKEHSLGEEDASKQGRNIADIVADAEITLVDETVEDRRRYNDQEMFDTDVLSDEEVVVEDVRVASIATAVTAATTVVFIDDITLAQALMDIKTQSPRQEFKDENLAWDNVQAMMDADYELAARLQEEEQGELTIEEKSRLFVELLDKRKKHFTKLIAEEKRRKPLIKA
uniref:Ribonuclease H-like domain-containing protein n=1 Tax=Tanacetum cinerariifolium TaxID=118510 RepID=A0A699H7L7_TANCI|nr:ribonuclease H-like domain-containing protein [Tanacetum cinerariifolium]